MAVINSVEDVYRKPYEVYAVAAWALAGVSTAIAAVATGMPWQAAVALIAVSSAMALLRVVDTHRLIEAKLSLAGREWWTLPVKELKAKAVARPDALYLGKGFVWEARHAERAKQLARIGTANMMPPQWLLKLMRKPNKFQEIKGEPWIHGLEPNEQDLFTPWRDAEGHWKIFGVTGAGKTRLYEMLLYQFVRRGDVVILIDPKYDAELKRTADRACAAAGRPDAMAFFNPAMPRSSVRLDMLANYARETELASRTADIVPGEDDNFKAFVWKTVNAVNMGLLYCQERPSLRKIRYYVENGPEELLERVLAKFLATWRQDWENLVQGRENLINGRGKAQPPMKTGSVRAQAMVWCYLEDVEPARKIDDISGLVAVAVHSRDHLAKMIAGFTPQITKLTAGTLGELLSPDYDDAHDQREILDTEKIIRGKRVLYMCTDSLADSSVGSTLAGFILSDAKGSVGARYNREDAAAEDTYIHLIIDEASEAVNEAAIALANKARGAKVIMWVASQNVADYVVKLGSVEKMRMFLGNFNNTICLRSVDTDTQKYIVESIGEVSLASVETGRSSNVQSEKVGIEFGTGRTTRVKLSDGDLFPPYLLGRMSDLHYVSLTSGGKLRKGRLGKISWAS